EMILSRAFEQDAPRLIKFDSSTGGLTFETDGFHQFVFDPSKAQGLPPGGVRIEHVDLVGDFNGWRVGAPPLFDFGPREGWMRIVELPDGVHHYRFVVNGCFWLEDPASDPRFRESNGNGGFNSGVLVGDDASGFERPSPDHVDRGALKHNPRRSEYF